MPTLNLIVNTKIADPKALALELSRVGSTVLDKPVSLICALITYNEALAFGGTFDPAFYLKIECLGRTLGDKDSQTFANFLTEKLGISNDRGLITFYDPGSINVGYKGVSVATLFASGGV